MTRMSVALLLALSLAACNDDADAGYQGYMEGEYLRIAAPDGGWINTIPAVRGRQVQAGEPLFALDPVRERAAVAQAEADLAKARSDLADLRLGARPEEIASIEAQIAEAEANQLLTEQTLARQIELVRTRSSPVAQLDDARAKQQQALAQVAQMRAQLAVARLASRPDRIQAAEAAVESAQHALEQAQWRLAQRQVASPAAGLIDDVVRRPGEWVPANGVVVSLLPPANIRAVFFVPEPRRADFRPDQRIAVACTGCPPNLFARVSRVASEVEFTPPVIFSRETRAKLVFRIEALMEPAAGNPLPGQPITARIAP